MSAISRFVRFGLQDADRRLRRLTAPVSPDEREVVETIESSRVCRVASLVLDRVQAAASSSAVLANGRTAFARWSTAPWSVRRLTSGVTILVAAAVHVLLTVLQGAPPGWLWLVVPAMALIIGAVLVIASGKFWRGTASG